MMPVMRLVQDSVNQLLNLTANTNPLVGLGLYTAAIGLLFYALDKKYDLVALLTDEHEIIDVERYQPKIQWSCGNKLVSPWKQEERLLPHRRQRYPRYEQYAFFRVLYEQQALPGIAEERPTQTAGAVR